MARYEDTNKLNKKVELPFQFHLKTSMTYIDLVIVLGCKFKFYFTNRTSETLKSMGTSVDSGEITTTMTCCNKETGAGKKHQQRTRGIWLCATGGGHIQMWQPLYQSEGPSQVFLLTLTWLVAAFGKESRERWKEITLSYDNMCHLNNLKVAREDLPLP
uniref:Uncharacterized protein n=1 Tax=Amphimedon queenslandica TaxID=400682 RepID=A0A1X7T5N6_AMPQE